MSKKETKTKVDKKPWPTKDAMQQVYEMNLWGSGATNFYSGDGSHRKEIITPYIEALVKFLKAFESPVSVCDLGCGDFNVGKELVSYTNNYVAVDIVPELIERNKKEFKFPNLEFKCIDIAVDELPIADCAMLRQVLQHISNAEVRNVVEKLYDYKYLIVTEHVPENDFVPNIDIISGQGTRLKKQSGIDLMATPFNLNVTEEKQLLSVSDGKGVIVTTMYKIDQPKFIL